MKPHSLVLVSVLALAACEGDSGPFSGDSFAPPSAFYDRNVITVDGQNYTVVTQPSDTGGEDRYYVFVNGRYHECSAPTAEACADPVRIALSNEEH